MNIIQLIGAYGLIGTILTMLVEWVGIQSDDTHTADNRTWVPRIQMIIGWPLLIWLFIIILVDAIRTSINKRKK